MPPTGGATGFGRRLLGVSPGLGSYGIGHHLSCRPRRVAVPCSRQPVQRSSVRPAFMAAPARAAPAAATSAGASTPPLAAPAPGLYPGQVDPLLLDDLLPDGVTAGVTAQACVQDPDHGYSYGDVALAHPEQLQQLQGVLQECAGVFAATLQDLPGYVGSDGKYPGAEIPLDTDERLFDPPRRYNPLQPQIQDEKCGELHDVGFISEVPTTNPYASNCTMPAKKDANGEWVEKRFCVDYAPKINPHTIPDGYRPPLPEDLFTEVGTSRVFSTLDLKSGFHQIPLSSRSKRITAFW